MQTANNVSEVVGVDVEDPADDDADGDVSFTTPTMESPSRAISNDDNENPSSINTTKWRFISFAAFLVAAVIIVVEISVDLPFDSGNESRFELSTPAGNASAKKVKNSPASGYNSCNELQDYLRSALNNTVHYRIDEEVKFSNMYRLCEPNNPDWWVNLPGIEERSAPYDENYVKRRKILSPGFASPRSIVHGYGVDDADIVKSDGEHIYAAYGEFLYAWNATDGPKKGVSITELPNERFNVCDVTTLEHESSNSKADKAEPCFYFKPKPTIVALLLHGTRLAVIISEESLRDIDDFYPPISIRVYDISVIPTDGSSLKLLAKSEKPIKASYFVDAISNENIGYLVFTSEINLEELQLSRDKPQYCGLNSTEYTDLAMMTASNMTDIFIESLLEELQLLMDGSCANIFMVTLTCMPVILDPACVHSSYTPPLSPHLTCYVEKWFLHCKKERASGKTLGSFVRVFRFDMKSDFFIDFDVVGAFFTGLPIVYATQDFMALIGEEMYYNNTFNNPVIKSYILGFNTSYDDRETTIFEPSCYGRISGGATYEFYYTKDRYSADLHEGYFRVITTVGNRAKISVLKMPHLLDSEREMLVVGDTSFDLIHSGDSSANQVVFARFMGDKVYIEMLQGTTHVFDLSNHSDLKEVGKLELSGYSEHSYLEPVTIDGVQCMLGIRQTGWESGFEINLVDISEATNLHKTATYVKKNQYSSAVFDFKELRYLGHSQHLIIGLAVFNIRFNSITLIYRVNFSEERLSGGHLPARSFVFGSNLTTFLSHSAIGTDLETGKHLWTFNLESGLCAQNVLH